MSTFPPHSDPKPTTLSVVLALSTLASAFAALYFFGSHEVWSRSAGLALTFLAGGLAWSVQRMRARDRANAVKPAPGYMILIIFGLCGVAGFFMPEEGRWRLAWFFVVFLRRLPG